MQFNDSDLIHFVTQPMLGDEESPTGVTQIDEMDISAVTQMDKWDIPAFYSKGGGKYYIVEEDVQLMKGGRRYSWDIPPDIRDKASTFNGIVQSSLVGGRKFSWDKPPNLTDFNDGSVNLQYMGGKHYRWDSYRAPSLEEFVDLWI